MNFSVPQYIEIEDKIVGPFTFKQFVYLLGGLGVCYLLYRFLPSVVAFPLMLPFVVLALALAFYKVNNRPFINTLQSAITFFLAPKLYVWKRGAGGNKIMPTSSAQTKSATQLETPNNVSESKLRDLAWSLDINEKVR